jgi:hypothetical protein
MHWITSRPLHSRHQQHLHLGAVERVLPVLESTLKSKEIAREKC